MKVSVIIPCLNEEGYLEKTLNHLNSLPGNFEIIVVDGGSSDSTIKIAKACTWVRTTVAKKGRANQMNHGARLATGDILLFLHADTYLPTNAYSSIVEHVEKPGHIGGSFMLRLDKKHPILKFYTWCSKLSWEYFTYGDHAMFMKKKIFQSIGGYSNMPFMEDVEIQRRLRSAGKFKKVDSAVTTSARRFEKEGTIKQLTMDILLVGFYKFGISPKKLKQFYKD